jgi:hypothetical protein
VLVQLPTTIAGSGLPKGLGGGCGMCEGSMLGLDHVYYRLQRKWSVVHMVPGSVFTKPNFTVFLKVGAK